MVFKKGDDSDRNTKGKNNVHQKLSGWRLGRTIRGKMDEIVEEMFSLLHDDDPSIRVQMIKILLDRGLGKVPDQLEFMGPAGGPLKITFEVESNVNTQQAVIELDEQSGFHALPQARHRLPQ